MESKIPDPEVHSLVLTATEATDLAAAGDINDGHRALQGGLARAVEAQEGGEPWGEELVGRYLDALRRYEGEYEAGCQRN